MMEEMDGMGWGMGMGLLSLLVFVLLVLGRCADEVSYVGP